MNWRSLLFRYAAKVADECEFGALAESLRVAAMNVPQMDGGGFRLLRGQDDPGLSEAISAGGRLYQALPDELPCRGPWFIAFTIPIESSLEERPYYRPVLPEWAKE